MKRTNTASSHRRGITRVAMVSAIALALTPFTALPASGASTPAPDPGRSTVEVGPVWTDVDGNRVEAHGGAANFYLESDLADDVTGDGDLDDGVYLLYGEKKTNATRPVDGVNGYWSTDLENWHSLGTVLKTHNVLPFAVDGDQLVLNEANLAELKRLADLTPEEAGAQGVVEQAATSRAFIEAYVTSRDSEGTATGYDEAALRIGFTNLYGLGNIIERPKMIYNAQTEQYVIIFHGDSPWNWDYANGRTTWANPSMLTWVSRCAGPDGTGYTCSTTDTNQGSRYSRAELSFAVADAPSGPFTLVNSTQLNVTPGVSGSGMSRDMTVFVDAGKDVNADGVDDAYAVYSSEHNAKMYISLLDADYTAPAKAGAVPQADDTWRARTLPDDHREASSVFFWGGWYYMLTSGTNGWASTEVRYYRAKSMLQAASWERVGNPFIGAGAGNGYDSQPTYVLVKDQAKGEFIYMGDRWRTEANGSAGWDSRLIWLPIQLTSDPAKPFQIAGRESWDPFDATNYRTVTLSGIGSFTVAEGDADALSAQLPATVSVRIGGEADVIDADVIWDAASIQSASRFAGTGTVKGTLTITDPRYAGFSGYQVTAPVTVTDAEYRRIVALGAHEIGAGLPDSIDVGGASVAVTWDPQSVRALRAADAFSATRIAGTATIDGAETYVIGEIATLVPAQTVYVADSGRLGQPSQLHDTTAAVAGGLLNRTTADQRWDGADTSATWGYSTAASILAAGSAGDWRSSYIGANYSQPVTYRFTLPAGTYRIGTVQAPRTGETRIYSTISAAGATIGARSTAVANGPTKPIVQTVTVPARDDGSETVVEAEFGTDGTSGFNARLALVWVAQVADASALQEAIDGAEQLEETEYSSGSWQRLANALESAEVLLGDDQATQKEIDEAASGIEDAQKSLVSLVALRASLAAAAALDAAQYSVDSWSSLQRAVEDAQSVLDDASIDAATAQDAVDALQRAIDALQPGDTATARPAAGVLSSNNGWDTGLHDGDFQIEMNLWWGENATRFLLYRDGALVADVPLTHASPAAQRAKVDIAGLVNGSYRFTGVLVNSRGTTDTTALTVVVRDAAPGKPVLSSDNWSGGGSFTVTADLWWGTNATSYRFLENGVEVATSDLDAATPAAQRVALPVVGKPVGTYRYVVEFTNAVGSTRSEPIEVTVRR